MVYRIDNNTATQSLPAIPVATGQPGFFTNGNPVSGQGATVLEASWLNMVQEELVGVVLAAGLPLDRSNNGQLLSAITSLVNARPSGISEGRAGELLQPVLDDIAAETLRARQAEAALLPLAGGTLTGHTTLQDNTGNDSKFSLVPARGRAGYVSIEGSAGVLQMGSTTSDADQLSLVACKADFSEYKRWYADRKSGAFVAPDGHSYLEMAQSGAYKIQSFTTAAKSGDWIAFPEQFSGDDVRVSFTSATNAGQLNLFSLDTDRTPYKTALGFGVAAMVIIPGGSTPPFVLKNSITLDVIAIGPA